MKEMTFSKDQVIFRQGDYATVMYDIRSGRVGIYTDYQTEKEKEIAVLEAGQTFGEMGLIEYYPRSATAVALEDAVLIEIGDSELNEYFKNEPEKLLKLMRELSKRLRETTENYVNICRTLKAQEQAKDAEEFARIRRDMEQYARYYCYTWMS